ncbi:MAG: ArsR family transcriptional regulator [Bacteroidales bacterium]
MLDTLITNKTRLRLLLRFFLNPDASSYLRGLEEEFGESTNSIRVELNRFEAAGLLVSWEVKNKKMFSANQQHPLFADIRSILRKHTGIDTIITDVINNLGNIQSAYLNDMTSKNMDHLPLELFIFGDPIDQEYLATLTNKATTLIKRDIKCTTLPVKEEKKFLANNRNALLVWKK